MFGHFTRLRLKGLMLFTGFIHDLLQEIGVIYGHMTNANRLLMKSLQWKISWSSHEETFVNGKMTFKIIFILFNATRLFSYILKISVKFCFLCFQGV